MEDNPYNDGKRFLEGLIHRAETLLMKMVLKLEQSCIPLKEVITMINSVHEFVNTWEDAFEAVPDLLEFEQQSFGSPTQNRRTLDVITDQIPFTNQGSTDMSIQSSPVSFRQEAYPDKLIFDFPDASMDHYKPGQTGLCSITMLCSHSDEFYMIDLTPHEISVIYILKTLQNLTSTLHALPQSSAQAFGVLLDGAILRAVRNKCTKQCFIKLIDIGEVLPFNQSMTLYELPPFYANLPAFALKCKLLNIEDETYSGSRLDYLEESLGIIRSFKIVSVEQSCLTVTLSGKPSVEIQPQTEKPIQDCTYGISVDTLTKDQLEDLYEEPMNTTNVMKAVLGYDPQDDRRICPFYDPALEGCFKGSRCRLEHAAKLTDGWTRDKALHKTKIRAELELPKVGSDLMLIPTYIANVDEFYAHIPLLELSEALIGMQNNLNDPKYVREFKELNHEPHFHELVFARYSADGLWYRAEVLEFYHSDQISVFYVDYGNIDVVDISQLRYWDDRFDYLPFQAVHCRVANIRPIRSNHIEAIEQLRNAILDKGVRVRILDNMSPWEVLLYDSDGNDIGEFLVITKLAKPREPLVMAQTHRNVVPV
ncbi:uncharacterized protein LOC131676312 [Topomyia yanbarensis]|uniref:uncharacterized protein LOC131676312 n=1 Tax=Topomyia yanbarensis TaxID=2498891 RepID=UPI00273BA55B|nr:uncharacterized protein LOC131676312 [Topomyia yanbarensis]